MANFSQQRASDVLFILESNQMSMGITKSCDHPRPSMTTHDQP